jgi:TetR/AcrR family fatty acid metabolism transcriptional regulator
MAKSTMTPRKEQAAKTRQEIFDTAIELFDSKGYENVSIVEICERAGVSTGAFYHHFKAKDQILMEEFLKVDGFYRELLGDISGMDDYREKLLAFTTATMRFMADMGLKRTKVTYHTQIGPDKKASYLGNPNRALYSIIEGLYREGQEKGEVRRDLSAEDLARLTIHCYRGIVYDWCLANGKFDMVKTGEEMVDMLTDGVLTKGTGSR